MKNILKPLEHRSRYDPAWRHWRDGRAPKFRLKLWQRLLLKLLRGILNVFARGTVERASIQTALSTLDRIQSLEESHRGHSEEAQRLLQQAGEKTSEAVRLAPDDPHAHFMHGLALHNLERKDEARREYEITLRLDPKHPQAHSMMSRVREQQGLLKEAIDEQSESLRLAPSPTGHLRIGELYRKAGNLEEARRHWEQVSELDKGAFATAARLRIKEYF